MNVMEMLEKEQMRGDIPDFNTGDTIKVFVRIVEGQKQRIQAFEGVVIRRRRGTSGPASPFGRSPMASVSRGPFRSIPPPSTGSRWSRGARSDVHGCITCGA